MMIRFSKIRPGLPVCSGRRLRDVAMQADPDVHLAVVAERRRSCCRSSRRSRSGIRRSCTAGGAPSDPCSPSSSCRDRRRRLRCDASRLSLPVAASIATIDRLAPSTYITLSTTIGLNRTVPSPAGKRPRDLELLHVGLVDLLQRRILRGIGSAEILGPRRVRFVVRGRHRPRAEAGDGRGDADRDGQRSPARYVAPGSSRTVKESAHGHGPFQGFEARIRICCSGASDVPISVVPVGNLLTARM